MKELSLKITFLPFLVSFPLLCQAGGFVEERRIEDVLHEALFWPTATQVIGKLRSGVGLLDLTTSRIVWQAKLSGPMAVDSSGKYLVSSGKILELKSGREIGTYTPVKKYNNYATQLVVSPTGKFFAVAIRSDWRIDFHQLPGGKPLNSLRTKDKALCLAFSPRGGPIAVSVSGPSGGIYLHDVRGRKQSRIVERNMREPWSVSEMVYSPNGRFLAGLQTSSSLSRARIFVWEVRSGKKVREIKAPVTNSLAFSKSGKWLAAAGMWPIKPNNQYAAIGVWEASSGKKIATVTDLGQANSVGLPFVFSPDGNSLAAAFDRARRTPFVLWKWDPEATPTSGVVGDSR